MEDHNLDTPEQEPESMELDERSSAIPPAQDQATFPDKPLNFHSCPMCGSTRRVAEEILNKEKAAGKCEGQNSAWVLATQSAIAPPHGRFLSCPVILAFMDVCVDCGAMYAVHVEVQTATNKAGIVKGMGQPPRNFGRN